MPEINFVSSPFTQLLTNLQLHEMKIRGEIYKEIAERFSFLSDVPYNITSSSTNIKRYSQCRQKLIAAYPENFNSNFSAELQQFHLYVRHKFSATKIVKTRFSHAELLCIEADGLRKIDYGDLIKDFARKKVGENYSTINKMEPYRNKYYLAF